VSPHGDLLKLLRLCVFSRSQPFTREGLTFFNGYARRADELGVENSLASAAFLENINQLKER
jgi:hypothetical protein